VEQLRIPAWKETVTRKQAILGSVYGWLKEVDTAFADPRGDDRPAHRPQLRN
jgi:hypothetical protein